MKEPPTVSPVSSSKPRWVPQFLPYKADTSLSFRNYQLDVAVLSLSPAKLCSE
jgi:hypothetical protein